MGTIRLTMAQALLRFLAQQYVVMDGVEHRFVQGVLGIFGHGNVTGLGEALEFDDSGLTFYQGHNEQGMAHAAVAFAKQKNRLGILKSPVSAGNGAGGLNYDIVPGDAAHSIVAYRMNSTEANVAMPELARTIIDKEGVQLIKNWINGMPK